jgi:hypothetical protein
MRYKSISPQIQCIAWVALMASQTLRFDVSPMVQNIWHWHNVGLKQFHPWVTSWVTHNGYQHCYTKCNPFSYQLAMDYLN